MPTTAKPKRIDGQITGLAGELFVAAELLKRGLQTSVTFGNAKAIDLFAHNPTTDRKFSVQVKALRKKNYFLIDHNKVAPTHTYVFVQLNEPGESVQYYVVPGKSLVNEPEKFKRQFLLPIEKMPGIHPDTLRELGYENAWYIFDEAEIVK